MPSVHTMSRVLVGSRLPTMGRCYSLIHTFRAQRVISELFAIGKKLNWPPFRCICDSIDVMAKEEFVKAIALQACDSRSTVGRQKPLRLLCTFSSMELQTIWQHGSGASECALVSGSKGCDTDGRYIYPQICCSF